MKFQSADQDKRDVVGEACRRYGRGEDVNRSLGRSRRRFKGRYLIDIQLQFGSVWIGLIWLCLLKLTAFCVYGNVFFYKVLRLFQLNVNC
jgi:hypothetical protein